MSDSRAVSYTIVDCPSVMGPSVPEHLIVGLRNTGRSPWKGMLAHATGNVCLAYHWKNAAGGVEVWDDHARGPIIADVPPGGEAVIFMPVTPPAKEGRFILQLTLLDGEAWFEQRGAPTYDVPVEVRALSRAEREERRLRMLSLVRLDDTGEEIRLSAFDQSAKIYGADNPQQNSYVKLNARRYATLTRVLQENAGTAPMRALNIGFSPIWALLLKKYFPAWEPFYADLEEPTYLHRLPGQDITFFNAEKDRFPYKDGTFDVIIVTELIEHLLSDPMHLVIEANRTLKPGGCLVISTPNVVRLGAVASCLDQGLQHPFSFSAYVAGGHHREYTPLEVRLLFLAGGFDIAYFDTLNVWPFEWQPSVIEETLALLERERRPVKWRGQDILAVGRKAGPVLYPRPYPLYLTAELNTVVLKDGYE